MFESLIAAVAIASLSLIGVVFFRKSGHITGTHRFIIPIAIGVFLGVVFFELIPETLHASEFYGALAIVGGFLGFYALSHFLRTYHHHHGQHEHDDCEEKKGASLLLVGDAVHNFADGIVIASAFLINPTVGIATTIAIALHEIPQEIAEYGVLRAAGYSTKKALGYNLLSASSVILGVLVSSLFIHSTDYIFILTGIAAGNLLYIAASDMIPELHAHAHEGHFGKTFLSTVIGMLLIAALITWSHERFGHGEEEHHDAEEELHADEEVAQLAH